MLSQRPTQNTDPKGLLRGKPGPAEAANLKEASGLRVLQHGFWKDAMGYGVL